MTTPELISFVKRELAVGETKEAISLKLKTQGWTEFDIIETFNIIPHATTVIDLATPPITKATPVVASPILVTHSSIVTDTPHVVSPSFPQATSSVVVVRRSNAWKILLPVLILLLLVGGALAYASGYIVSLEKIFSGSVQSSRENTSVKFDVNINVDASGMKGSENISNTITGMSPVGNIDMKGSYDIKDKDNPRSSSSFLLKSGSFEVGLDFRLLNKSIYINLTKAPNISFFSLKPFENRWIVMPESGSDSFTNNPLVSSSGVDSQFLSNLTDNQKQHIVDITNKASFIKITKKHLPEIVDGATSFHFDFDLNRQGILSYLKELAAYLKTIDKSTPQLSEINDSDFNKASDALRSFHGEAWIGIFDKLTHKIIINFDIANPNKLDDGVMKFMANITYSDWNKSVIVEVPKNTTTVEELMASVMGGMTSEFEAMPDENLVDDKLMTGNPLEDARTKATFAKIRSIHDSFRSQAELYYETNKNSYKGFCGNKGANGAYQLATTLPENSVYRCNDSQTEWAAWTKLPDNKYWCSDSTGASKSVSGGPKGTSCVSNGGIINDQTQKKLNSYYLKGKIFQDGTDPVPFSGVVNHDIKSQFVGEMSDSYGDSTITEFVTDSKSVTFKKKYYGRADNIYYSFKRKTGDVWHGTWNMIMYGNTIDTGTAELVLTSFSSSI